ncbi:hypothetical protein HAX54_042435 [Datura stramonium]|uniref:Uncharacterized protein n=1 Tax=Datura stramonium TaxID=4076 RepID=A0ABS8W1W7_DATST|nr:hypothetical protein [Datura stramonium]
METCDIDDNLVDVIITELHDDTAGEKQKSTEIKTNSIEIKNKKMWWIGRPSLIDFPLLDEDLGVELSRTGGSLKISFLKETKHLHSPSMIFLCETKNQERMIFRVQIKLQMEHVIIMDPAGLAGGLCLF